MNARFYCIFRVLFGAYLSIHFGMLVPYAAELFGSAGMLPDPALNPLKCLFLSPLTVWDIAPEFCALLTAVSVSFMCGWWPRAAAVLLWFGSTALFHRNNLTANPSLAYIGLLLLLSALVRRDGTVPRMAVICAWVLLAAGYSFSGLAKLGSPSWLDGSAMTRLMMNPLTRDCMLRNVLLTLPSWMMQALTWGTLLLEVAYVPLCLHRSSRGVAWLAMVIMHGGILLLVDFADLTLGMLMMHLFVFDPRWLPVRLRLFYEKATSPPAPRAHPLLVS